LWQFISKGGFPMKKSKTSWTIARVLLFLTIGIFNTALIRPEDAGSWKNYLGYFFLLIALIEIIFLIKSFLKKPDK
jgi:hypothetical protein